MCGIAGIFNPSQKICSPSQTATQMATAILHRGPDSQNHWLDVSQRLLLVHCRLAIQDLSPQGNQPMCSTSGRYTIVFNGEIYNFKYLASKLKANGISFRGHSDTEVLLAGFERWGVEKTIEQCSGMFAFALFDNACNTLTLARDRMGEKPLYYGIIDEKFYFASELKAIFSIYKPSKLTIDKGALASFLRYGYISAPNTIFNEIKKLKPGCLLTLDLSSRETSALIHQVNKPSTISTYWDLNKVRAKALETTIENTDIAKEKLDELLNSIVCEQIISDVPLGTFLSGGIDSSIVTAIAQANSEKSIDTFTIGFHEKNFNEAEHAKRVARHIGSRHHEVYVSPKDALNVISSLPSLYDEPFADSSQIPTFLVCQLARQKVTVCLSGDGGDELFAGYNRYCVTESMYHKIQQLPEPARRLFAKLLTSFPPVLWDKLYQFLKSFTGRKGASNIGLKVHKLGELFRLTSLNETYRYLTSYWYMPEKIIKNPEKEKNLLCEGSFETDFIETAMLWDQLYYLPGDNLVKSDRASMATSLEIRLPLIDHRLVDFSWQVPMSMKYREGKSKWLLREVLYQYVPRSIIDRPKMGFSIPIAKWLRHELKEWAESFLNNQYIEQQNIFHASTIQTIWNQHLSGRYDHSHKLWALLMFQSWYQRYIEE
jgi:asparagine synthase (glutamine-hydrolysing)